MKRSSASFYSKVLLASVMLMLGGCVSQLGPRYDTTLVNRLASANTEAMILIASTSQGTSSDTYGQRGDKYNSAIGAFDALAVQAAARPTPSGTVLTLANRTLQRHGVGTLSDDHSAVPSVYPIQKVAESLIKMRDTDRKQGITASESQAFKGQILIYLDQAITYENFLQP